MKNKLPCALIGYGYWGRILEKYLRDSDYFQLRYVYAPSLTNGITFDEILADTMVEAIFLCTPIDTHYELAKQCLQHHKHVFCEKPLTKILWQAKELAFLARQNHLCLYTDYIYTMSPSIQYLKKQIGRVGDVLAIEGEIRQFGNFYVNDSVMEVLGVHLLSVVFYLLGTDREWKLTGVGILRSDERTVFEEEIQMECLDAIKVRILCSLVSAVKTRNLHVSAKRGVLCFDPLKDYTAWALFLEKKKGKYIASYEEKMAFDENNNLEYAIKGFYDHIECNSPDNLELAVAVTGFLEKIRDYPVA